MRSRGRDQVAGDSQLPLLERIQPPIDGIMALWRARPRTRGHLPAARRNNGKPIRSPQSMILKNGEAPDHQSATRLDAGAR